MAELERADTTVLGAVLRLSPIFLPEEGKKIGPIRGCGLPLRAMVFWPCWDEGRSPFAPLR